MRRERSFFAEFGTEIKMFAVLFTIALFLGIGALFMLKDLYDSTMSSPQKESPQETKQ